MQTWLEGVQSQFFGFLLILARVSSIVVFAPVFGSDSIPRRIKVLVALVLGLALASALGFPAPAAAAASSGWVLAVAGEVMLGLAIGFTSSLIFAAVQTAGEVIGLQMGFGIVNVIDPNANVEVSIIGQMKFILAILVFLAVRGHHLIIMALMRSFEVAPPGGAILTAGTGAVIVRQFALVFEVAVSVAAPIIAALLVISAATGIISRSVPQVNFLVVGFAFRIGMGLLLLYLGINFYVSYLDGLFQGLPQQLADVIRTFQGP